MPRNGATVKTKSLEVGAPSGAVSAFAGTTAPTGWLLCDGSEVSRVTYSTLFAAIGTSCGSGNGSTTFNIPDYRGRFLRGVDGIAGNDPDKATRSAMKPGGATGNNVGSVQSHQVTSHRHGGPGVSGINPADGRPTLAGHGVPTNETNRVYWGTYEGGNETRPVNAGVNYIIKI
jgi:phage-related tail fiber protein